MTTIPTDGALRIAIDAYARAQHDLIASMREAIESGCIAGVFTAEQAMLLGTFVEGVERWVPAKEQG
jgi:hypothetical protein